VSLRHFVNNLRKDRDRIADQILWFELPLMQILNFHLTIHTAYRPLEGLIINMKVGGPTALSLISLCGEPFLSGETCEPCGSPVKLERYTEINMTGLLVTSRNHDEPTCDKIQRAVFRSLYSVACIP